MEVALAQPWFDSALERLEVRRGNRLLAIDPSIAEVTALRSLVGNAGELTLVMLDRQIAEQIAEHQWERVTVLAHATTGDETFGTHDSMLVVPRTGPLLPTECYPRLARNNLRPGGRFLIDLPGEDMLPDVRKAWESLGWDEERLQPLLGANDIELTEAANTAGLRSVHAALGSHLLHADSATDLAAAFATPLGLSDDEITELGHEIVSKRQQDGPIDALVHRSQVAGQR
jgi:hypothetical protein